jgi:hypothetical protein
MSNDTFLFDGYTLQLYTHQTKIPRKKKFFALKTIYKEDNILVQHARHTYIFYLKSDKASLSENMMPVGHMRINS